MAFQRVKINDHHSLPSGAIEVPPEKVVGFYQIVIETWERPADIWALKYGPMILGAAGAFNGWYGNLYFRKRLKLRSYGFVSTYIPNIILPFVIVQSLHSMFVQPDIFTNPLGCSLCKETRAGAFQLALGLIQPLVIVPASTFMFATRHFTYRIPSPIHNRREFFKFLAKVYAPLKVPMAVSAGLQVLLAFYITHMEENQFFHLQKAMVRSDESEKVDGTAEA